MVISFLTEQGSKYEIDDEAKTWVRFYKSPTNTNSQLRSTSGIFIEKGEIKVGLRFQMLCPPFTDQSSMRMISTSPVVEVFKD
jgi:hypothetical protein